jgi:hypothetical protein
LKAKTLEKSRKTLMLAIMNNYSVLNNDKRIFL